MLKSAVICESARIKAAWERGSFNGGKWWRVRCVRPGEVVKFWDIACQLADNPWTVNDVRFVIVGTINPFTNHLEAIWKVLDTAIWINRSEAPISTSGFHEAFIKIWPSAWIPSARTLLVEVEQLYKWGTRKRSNRRKCRARGIYIETGGSIFVWKTLGDRFAN